MAGIRLAVIDDGLFVRTYARDTRPVAATFHHFVAAVARTGAFERTRYVVPRRDLRIWEMEPPLEPVDEEALEIVPTTWFSGIADYLLRAGYVATRNWPIIDRAVREADLVWLRLPASNALLALAAARRHGVPHFGWVAGSVTDVAAAQPRPPALKAAAAAIGRAYDAVTELAGRGGPLLHLDADYFASVVTAAEVAVSASHSPAGEAPRERPWRIGWAGRMAAEKGLVETLAAFRLLLERGVRATLVLIGDGPQRRMVEHAVAPLPPGSVEDHGYVGERATYMEVLRSLDVLLHPSGAEGVPKVLVEALAAGVPAVALPAGESGALLGHGERGVLLEAGTPGEIATAVEALLADGEQRRALRERGLAWAADHTADAQAGRLVGWLQEHFPQLDWDA